MSPNKKAICQQATGKVAAVARRWCIDQEARIDRRTDRDWSTQVFKCTSYWLPTTASHYQLVPPYPGVLLISVPTNQTVPVQFEVSATSNWYKDDKVKSDPGVQVCLLISIQLMPTSPKNIKAFVCSDFCHRKTAKRNKVSNEAF